MKSSRDWWILYSFYGVQAVASTPGVPANVAQNEALCPKALQNKDDLMHSKVSYLNRAHKYGTQDRTNKTCSRFQNSKA